MGIARECSFGKVVEQTRTAEGTIYTIANEEMEDPSETSI